MIKEQDKEVLINSMKNLIKHIFQGPSHQTDIFKSLSYNDFNKIIDNLNDTNKSTNKPQIIRDNIFVKYYIFKLLFHILRNQVFGNH